MEYVKLSCIGDIITGNTPKTSNAENYTSNDIYFVKPSDLTESEITSISKTEFYISEYAREKSRILPINSILVTCIGTIGKVGINKCECAFNQQINAIIPDIKRFLPRYVAYSILSKQKKLQDIANAPVVPIINKTQFSQIEIKSATLKKQFEIAKTLDKVTDLITNRKQQLQKLDELVKSRFIDMFGDTKINPYGFENYMLKDTCKVVTGNTPSRAIEEYYGNYIEWIKTDNIVSGLLNPTHASEGLSEEGMKVGRFTEKDSILMACIAGSITSIGKACITDRRLAFNQQINAIIPQKYNVLFLYVLLKISKDYLVEEINMALKGILSKSKLEEKVFIVPPIELQNQFADFVAQVDKSKVEVQKSLEKLETLKKSLMQKYFG